jgi:hypothetical protein
MNHIAFPPLWCCAKLCYGIFCARGIFFITNPFSVVKHPKKTLPTKTNNPKKNALRKPL